MPLMCEVPQGDGVDGSCDGVISGDSCCPDGIVGVDREPHLDEIRIDGDRIFYPGRCPCTHH